MQPQEDDYGLSSSQFSSPSVSSSEPLTAAELMRVMEEFEASHPIIKAQRALSEFLQPRFPVHLVDVTPEAFPDMSWRVRHAVYGSQLLTGANAIGARRMSESLILASLLGDSSPTLPYQKASWRSRFISKTSLLWLHDTIRRLWLNLMRPL